MVFVCVVNPYVVIVAIPYVSVTLILRQLALSAGRELKRLEAVCEYNLSICEYFM